MIGLVGFTVVAGTSAAYIDHANLNLGGEAIGNPNEFEVQVADGSNWADADDEASAVVYPTTPDAVISVNNPIEYEATVRIEPGGPSGDVSPKLVLREDCKSACAALFEQMRFDVSLDGTLVASAVSSEMFNQLPDAEFLGVAPGDTHSVKLSVRLDPSTSFMLSGKETMIGLRFEGVSTP
ncbi:hypothetical protein ACXR2W_11575 [Leucobacter sp. HY1908]